MKIMRDAAAFVLVFSLGSQASAQEALGRPNPAYVANVVRHMARTPFGPTFEPPGFSVVETYLRRKDANDPLQIVRIVLKPDSEVSYQLLAFPMAAQLLKRSGGSAMFDDPYVAGASESVEMSAVGRERKFEADCFAGRDPAGRLPPREACAIVLTDQVLLISRAGGTDPDAAHDAAVSLLTAGLGYWVKIDDQLEDDFLKPLEK